MVEAGVQLYFVQATGDFITPDVAPYSYLLLVRARVSYEVKHLNLDAIAKDTMIVTWRDIRTSPVCLQAWHCLRCCQSREPLR